MPDCVSVPLQNIVLKLKFNDNVNVIKANEGKEVIRVWVLMSVGAGEIVRISEKISLLWHPCSEHLLTIPRGKNVKFVLQDRCWYTL